MNAEDCRLNHNPWSQSLPHPMDKMISICDGAVLDEKKIDSEQNDEGSISHHLQMLQELCQVTADIRNIRKSLLKMQLREKCYDLVSAEALEEKLSDVATLTEALEMLIKNQDKLLQQLQTPYKSDQIILEVHHHKQAVQVFQNLSTTLSGLHEHLDTLTWHKIHTVDSAAVSESLRHLSQRCLRLLEVSNSLNQTSASLKL